MKKITLALFSAAVLGFGLAACSLAGDVTPPPQIAPLDQQPAVTEAPATAAPTPAAADQTGIYPIVPPNPADGAVVYADKCEPCHGPIGLGDGGMAANLPNPVPAIGSAELARARRPVDWFAKVTDGAMQRGMPPFRSALTDRQRWDVVAYVFTLSQSDAGPTEGQALFAAECAGCHGENGQGDGPQAAGLSSPVIDWTDPSKLAGHSDQELYDSISAGQGAMPAYQDKMTADQLWSLVSYVRGFSFAQAPQPASSTTPAAQTTAEAALKSVTFTGQVVYTGSGSLPTGLSVTLNGYDSMNVAYSNTAAVASDGSFRFANVPVNDQRVFMASLVYQGTTFNSDVVHSADLSGAEAALQITLYDTSTDASALTADRLHLIFDFSSPGVVNVAEIYLLDNPTDKVIVPADGKPVLSFSLPKGATNLQFPNSGDPNEFTRTENGFDLNLHIPPGSGYQLVYTYELPFKDSAVVELSLPLPVQSPVAMVTSGGVKLSSPQFTSVGTRSVEGISVDLYTSGPLAAGQKVKIKLGNGNLNQTLAVALGGLALVLIAAGILMGARSRKLTAEEEAAVDDEPPLETEDELLDAIIALDDQFANGEIGEEEHARRRAELKEKLKQFVD